MCDIGGKRASYDGKSVKEQIYFCGVNLQKIGFWATSIYFWYQSKIGTLVKMREVILFESFPAQSSNNFAFLYPVTYLSIEHKLN